MDFDYDFDYDILDACARLGLVVDKYARVLCPFHNETKASLQLYLDSHSFYCFGCGAWGDAVDLVEQMLGLNKRQAVDWLNGDSPREYLAPLRRREEVVAPDPTRYDWLDMDIVSVWTENLRYYEPAKRYLANRGIREPDTWLDLLIGWTGKDAPAQYQDMLAMPYFDHYTDTVHGVKFRSISEKRFRAAGSLSRPYLWSQVLGQFTVRRELPIFVVEGELDALLISDILGGAWSCLATPAGKINARLARELASRPRVMLLADADEAGEQAASKLQRSLGNLVVEYPPFGKDVGEFFLLEPETAEEWIRRLYYGQRV